MTRQLNAQQLKFCELVASGIKPFVAYPQAYPDATAIMRRSKPCQMMKKPHIIAAIDALRKQDMENFQRMVDIPAAEVAARVIEVGLKRAEKRRILRAIATNRRAKPADRIRAIQVDNEMTGDNAPVRVEGEITLHSIFTDLRPTTGLPSPDEAVDVNAYDPNEKRTLGP